MCAVLALCPDIVEMLLEHGAKADTRSSKGFTAIELLTHKETELWQPMHLTRAAKIRTLLEQAPR